MNTYRTYISDFSFFVTSGQVIFWPAPIISLSENNFFAYKFWTRYDRQMKMAFICLSHHSESNDMQHDLLWPDLTSDLWSNFDLDFLKSNWVLSDLPRREEQNGSEIDALDPLGQKLFNTHICAINWCLTSVNFDLWSLNRWPEVINLRLYCRLAVLLRIFSFLPLVAIYHSLGSRAAQLGPALLTGKCENFAMMTSFDLENIDLGSPNLDPKEFLYGPTYPLYFVFLALTGAEIAGGGQILPPSPPGRVILRPSTGSAWSYI